MVCPFGAIGGVGVGVLEVFPPGLPPLLWTGGTVWPVDEPDEFASLVDPTDYAVMVPLVDEADAGGGGPGAGQPRKQAAPVTPEPEEDELLL